MFGLPGSRTNRWPRNGHGRSSHTAADCGPNPLRWGAVVPPVRLVWWPDPPLHWSVASDRYQWSLLKDGWPCGPGAASRRLVAAGSLASADWDSWARAFPCDPAAPSRPRLMRSSRLDPERAGPSPSPSQFGLVSSHPISSRERACPSPPLSSSSHLDPRKSPAVSVSVSVSIFVFV